MDLNKNISTTLRFWCLRLWTVYWM